jgi:hypothetical protein
MQGKYVVQEITLNVWTLSHVTPVAVAAGRTPYRSAEAAAAVARERDPDAVIEIQELAR